MLHRILKVARQATREHLQQDRGTSQGIDGQKTICLHGGTIERSYSINELKLACMQLRQSRLPEEEKTRHL
jgi:hypothetical protein